jgi:hypothetical protein
MSAIIPSAVGSTRSEPQISTSSSGKMLYLAGVLDEITSEIAEETPESSVVSDVRLILILPSYWAVISSKPLMLVSFLSRRKTPVNQLIVPPPARGALSTLIGPAAYAGITKQDQSLRISEPLPFISNQLCSVVLEAVRQR